MRAVVTFIAIRLIVRLTINMLELAAVYLVVSTMYSLARRGARWTYRFTAAGVKQGVKSGRAAKAKAKKLVTTLPLAHAQHYPLPTIPEGAIQSDLLATESDAFPLK